MNLARSFITDKNGKIKIVIIDYEYFKKNRGINPRFRTRQGKKEVEGDEEIDLETAMATSGFKKCQ